MIRPVLLLLVLGLATGCRTPPPGKAAVSWRTPMMLQPVSALERPPAYALHTVTIERKEQVFSFAGQIEVSGDTLTLAGISLNGSVLFLIEYGDGPTVYEPHAMVPDLIQARFILADLQAMYWPVAALRAGGLKVKEPEPGRRTIYRGWKQVIDIRYADPADPWNSRIEYWNGPRKLRITVQPVPQGVPPTP